MQTLLITHPLCLEHDTGYGHPECSERLQALLKSCQGIESLDRAVPSKASMEQLAYVHSREYLESLFRLDTGPRSDILESRYRHFIGFRGGGFVCRRSVVYGRRFCHVGKAKERILCSPSTRTPRDAKLCYGILFIE